MTKRNQGRTKTDRGHHVTRRSYVPPYTHLTRKQLCRPYFQVPGAGALAENFWNVPDLCAAYNWPTGLAGGGVIAIVEFGGGWVQSDLDQFFAGIGQPSPTITDCSVDGTVNTPSPDPYGYDREVALGIQVAAASYYVATGKPASIRVYWSADIAMAVRAATSDGCDVCSISWGYDEAQWIPPETCNDMELAAAAATEAGMVGFEGRRTERLQCRLPGILSPRHRLRRHHQNNNLGGRLEQQPGGDRWHRHGWRVFYCLYTTSHPADWRSERAWEDGSGCSG